ncbi:hypothetical protein L7F22_061650 [Adiantum nelumboides]|nr:hypothetical protein [Adiantum nelumboides]
MDRRQPLLASSADSSYSAPWIFLSHSGKQKPNFVTPLYHALLHANHLPFFDQDVVHSLPAGDEYPPRIFQACRDCKMGVVVVSKDYVQRLWPMLELQQLLLLPLDGHRLIYPVFYDLQPADLSKPHNLQSWMKIWEELAAKYNWQRRMLQLQPEAGTSRSTWTSGPGRTTWQS